jgi:hypothetical protein
VGSSLQDRREARGWCCQVSDLVWVAEPAQPPEPTRLADPVWVEPYPDVLLLTSDAWLTMPPEPYEYQGPAAIAAFLRHRAALPR